MMAWTEEAERRLRELWDSGMPTMTIAASFRVSKNAIVGKAHRLSLTPRPSPIKRRNEEGVLPAPRLAPPAPRVTLAPLPSAATNDVTPSSLGRPARQDAKPVRVAAQRPASGDVSRAPLPPAPQCQWIDGYGRPWTICGRPTHGSWCADHHRRVFVRRAAPAALEPVDESEAA